MPRPGQRSALLLCLLALWLQMLAPALALGMQRHAFDPHAAICHGAGAGDHDQHRNAPPHAPACDRCLVCHAALGTLPEDGRPPFTRLDYPVVGPSRWAPVASSHGSLALRRTPPPRGPPLSV